MDKPEMTLDELKTQLSAAKNGAEQIQIAAEYALHELGAVDVSSKKSSAQLSEYLYDELQLDLRASRGSFPSYISWVVRSAETAIASAGRGRAGGYYLSASANVVVEQSQDRGSEVPKQHTKFEDALYPILKNWFDVQGYRTKITASMRTLGKWSNPDVTGIRVNEHLGRVDIEIATIEAKRDLNDWERVFFEAVSHRRFATRAYFAFPLPESGQAKIPDDMRYYSELYNVGVLVIILTDDDYQMYQKGNLGLLAGYEPSDVVEALSARSAYVPLSQQRRFCEAISIDDMQSLMRWGL